MVAKLAVVTLACWFGGRSWIGENQGPSSITVVVSEAAEDGKQKQEAFRSCEAFGNLTPWHVSKQPPEAAAGKR
jgi:hypothetical protein